MGSRSKRYRRRGPDGVTTVNRLLDQAALAARGPLSTRTARRTAAAAVPLAVAATCARKRLGLHPAASLLTACAVPLGIAISMPRGRKRYGAMFPSYMWLFKVSWELPCDDRERLRKRLMIDYPIAFDTWIGGGVPPGVRLQRALRADPARVTALDRVVAALYASWFLPHVLLAYLLMRHHEYLPRAAARLSASYHLTTPFYWVVPTAPPWWASEEGGRMNGELRRVLRYVVYDALKRPVPERDSTPGNPWGSMPSDHIASAAITAMGLAEVNKLCGALGWTYVGAASFAVVYLGEHYVIDVLVGLACAEIVRRAEPLCAPFIRAVALAVE
jgi:membrane-associated phospholipid phosphatase